MGSESVALSYSTQTLCKLSSTMKKLLGKRGFKNVKKSEKIPN